MLSRWCGNTGSCTCYTVAKLFTLGQTTRKMVCNFLRFLFPDGWQDGYCANRSARCREAKTSISYSSTEIEPAGSGEGRQVFPRGRRPARREGKEMEWTPRGGHGTPYGGGAAPSPVHRGPGGRAVGGGPAVLPPLGHAIGVAEREGRLVLQYWRRGPSPAERGWSARA